MIVNAYAVLDAFITLVRLGLGMLAVVLGAAALRGRLSRDPSPEHRETLEDRTWLLHLLSGLLLALNVVSWPVFHLLLHSYVPEWPGVMCIYGVTRIGSGSLNAARFLPLLATSLQILKPALVFVSGCWFVLHLVDRRTRTAPLAGTVLTLLTLAGLLAVVDASAETAYLVIPKKEVFVDPGCCTAVFDGGESRFLPTSYLGERATPWLYGSYYAVNLSMAGALFFCGRRAISARAFPVLAVGALLTVAVDLLFLIEVASPRLLRLPDHHCPYDLVSTVPESLLMGGLAAAGVCFVGWACLVRRFADGRDTFPFAADLSTRLLRLAFVGYAWSMLMMSVELAVS